MSSDGQQILKGKPPSRPAKRTNTTKACDECRRRRAKCDGRKPSCTRCTNRGINCQFAAKEDGRKPASKSYVSLLRERIRTLEGTLQKQSVDAGAKSTELPREDSSTPTSDVDYSSRSAGNVQMAKRNGGTEIEQLSQRFEGTLNLDQDGETHFYGATSGRLDFLTSSQGVPDIILDHNEGVTRLTIPSFLQQRLPISVPDELQLHLIELYFTWSNPWCPVIHEGLFRDSVYSGGKYCSPLLLMCIFSMGSRFTDRPEVRSDPADPYTAGKAFLEEAETLLQVELKSPKVTTIQSLIIMSVSYCAFGYDSACWLHEGMASRLMLEMGFNIDTAPLVASGSMPAEEAMLRRQIYWSLYSVDKLSASYTGRACTMLSHQGAVQMPLTSKEPATDATVSHQDESMMFLDRQVKLCQLIEEILLNLYAPRPAITEAQQRKAFLDACILKFKNWAYDLPQELRLGMRSTADTTNKKPHVYTLHMMCHTAHILLAKPFFTDRSHIDDFSAPEVTKNAKSICLEAARGILSIARAYQQAFGSFRRSPVTATHCTLSAAVALFDIQKDDIATVSQNTDLLKTSLNVLGELSTSWDIARRLRSHLLRLFCSRKIAIGSLDDPPLDSAADVNSMLFWERRQVAECSTIHQGPHSMFAESLPAGDLQDFGNWLDMIDDEFLQSALDPTF